MFWSTVFCAPVCSHDQSLVWFFNMWCLLFYTDVFVFSSSKHTWLLYFLSTTPTRPVKKDWVRGRGKLQTHSTAGLLFFCTPHVSFICLIDSSLEPNEGFEWYSPSPLQNKMHWFCVSLCRPVSRLKFLRTYTLTHLSIILTSNQQAFVSGIIYLDCTVVRCLVSLFCSLCSDRYMFTSRTSFIQFRSTLSRF